SVTFGAAHPARARAGAALHPFPLVPIMAAPTSTPAAGHLVAVGREHVGVVAAGIARHLIPLGLHVCLHRHVCLLLHLPARAACEAPSCPRATRTARCGEETARNLSRSPMRN